MKYTEIQDDLFKHLIKDNNNWIYTKNDVPVYCHYIANNGRWSTDIATIFIDETLSLREEILHMLNHHK